MPIPRWQFNRKVDYRLNLVSTRVLFQYFMDQPLVTCLEIPI